MAIFDEALSGITGLFDDPTLLSGLGMQLAGTVLRSRANDKISQQQASLIAQNKARQQALQDEINQRIAQTTGTMTRPAQDQSRQQIEGDLAARFTPPPRVDASAEYIPGNPGAPAVVGDTLNRRMAEAAEKGKSYAGSAARLSAYGLQNQNNNIAIGRSGQDVNRTADFMRGNDSILPYQLNAAKTAGNGMVLGSDIANGLGQMVMNYAMTRPDPTRLPMKTRILLGGRRPEEIDWGV